MRRFVGAIFKVSLSALLLSGCKSELAPADGAFKLSNSKQSLVGSILDPSLTFPGPDNYAGLNLASLSAAYVCNNKTFFGASGTAVCLQGSATTPAGVSDVISGQEYWDLSGIKRNGTMANNGAPTLVPAVTDQNLSSGYYSGGVVRGDLNLVDSNIFSGVTIFGVTGTAIGEAHNNCTAGNQTGCIGIANYKTQSVPVSPALGADVLSGKEFYTGGALITGLLVNHGSWNPGTTAWPGAGYYSGITASLASSDICSSQQIFGVSGTAVCRIDAPTLTSKAAAAQIRNGYEAWDKDGNRITGSLLETAIWDLRNYFPGAGYVGGVSHLPTADQIISGITILGVTGSAPVAWNGFASSGILRDVAAGQITQASELNSGSCDLGGYATRVSCEQNGRTWIPSALAGNYREISSVQKDNDGVAGTIVQYAPRPQQNCGIIQAGIEARIADCLAQNGSNASWNGIVLGNGGQNAWKLVTRSALNKEVWKDMRTGFVWSSLAYNGAVPKTDTWCKAVGNTSRNLPTTTLSISAPEKGSITLVSIDDGAPASAWGRYDFDPPSGNFVYWNCWDAGDCAPWDSIPADGLSHHTNLNTTVIITNTGAPFSLGDSIDINTIGSTGECPTGMQPATNPVSYCVEQAAPIVSGFSGDNWAAGTYDDSKGGMGENHSTTKVRWRVPTLADYIQANLDGILMVMPDMGKAGAGRPSPDASLGGNNFEWSATSSRAFHGYDGKMAAGDGATAIRCIGR